MVFRSLFTVQFVLFMSQESFFNFLKKYKISILTLAGRASNLHFGFSLPSKESFFDRHTILHKN
jgi:hypothetical protein